MGDNSHSFSMDLVPRQSSHGVRWHPEGVIGSRYDRPRDISPPRAPHHLWHASSGRPRTLDLAFKHRNNAFLVELDRSLKGSNRSYGGRLVDEQGKTWASHSPWECAAYSY